MNARPSAAKVRAPEAFLKKIGSPPTLRNARTGEFTPPGIYRQASVYRLNRLSRCTTNESQHLKPAVRCVKSSQRRVQPRIRAILGEATAGRAAFRARR